MYFMVIVKHIVSLYVPCNPGMADSRTAIQRTPLLWKAKARRAYITSQRSGKGLPSHLICFMNCLLSLLVLLNTKLSHRFPQNLLLFCSYKPEDLKSKHLARGLAALTQVPIKTFVPVRPPHDKKYLSTPSNLCPTNQSPKLLLQLFIPVYTCLQEIMNPSKILGDVHTP